MKMIISLFISCFMFCALATDIKAEEGIYYTRCNLKVLKGSYISWVNWQSAKEYLQVGTKVQVKSEKNKISLFDVNAKRNYVLDMGQAGNSFLDKFVTKRPVDINRFPKEIQANVNGAVARVGMTKEQVYIAMGPPAWITSGNTNTKTYENILATNLWLYKRRRFGKNIGIEFDSATGQAVRTEGIWR